MTEVEWLTCADLKRMLRLVRVKRKERKLRLFAVACCRRIWDRLTDKRCRDAVNAAERLADGTITTSEASEHREAAYEVANARLGVTYDRNAVDWYAMAVAVALGPFGERFAGSVYSLTGLTRKEEYNTAAEWRQELAAEVDLLREIFGNAYRPSPSTPHGFCGTTTLSRRSPKSFTTTEPSTVCPSLPMPWKKPAATMRTS